MKNTDNLFTRMFLRSLSEAVAPKEDAPVDGDPIADVEAGGTNVDALSTPPVEGGDPALAGAEGDASALASNENLVNQMVSGIEKAGNNAKELQTLSNNLESLKQNISKMLQNPATSEYAQKIASAIEDSQRKIQDKLAKFSDAVTDMNGGNGQKTLFGVTVPSADNKIGGGPAPEAAPAGEPAGEPAPEGGAEPPVA